VFVALCSVSANTSASSDLTIDARAWRIVTSESGPVNYYAVVTEGAATFVRARYVPPMKTAVLGWQTPDADRQTARKLRWSWRAQTLPVGGNECAFGKGDSAAVVYVTWRRFLKYYALKYVWSAVGTKGKICDRKRNPFVAQDTIILESGGPVSVWHDEEIDLAAEFRNHFENGDASAEVPDFVGIGIMSDGDQTRKRELRRLRHVHGHPLIDAGDAPGPKGSLTAFTQKRSQASPIGGPRTGLPTGKGGGRNVAAIWIGQRRGAWSYCGDFSGAAGGTSIASIPASRLKDTCRSSSLTSRSTACSTSAHATGSMRSSSVTLDTGGRSCPSSRSRTAFGSCRNAGRMIAAGSVTRTPSGGRLRGPPST